MEANGEQVRSTGLCRRVEFTMGKRKFMADLFVLRLERFDVLLGVDWLSMLGKIE